MKGILLAAALLSGCATGQITRNMGTLKGAHVRDAFARLGSPDSQQIVLGDTVYSRGTDQPTGPSCVVKVVVGPDNIIKSWNAYGNDIGCRSRVN